MSGCCTKDWVWAAKSEVLPATTLALLLPPTAPTIFARALPRKSFPSEPQVCPPWLVAAMGAGANSAFNFGGGINYWFRPNRAFRLEVRDYMFNDSDHKWEMRVGFTF
jgi:hypothetical protein